MHTTEAAPARRLGARLARPTDLVERTRWLFGVCALISLAVSATGALATGTGWQLVLLVASSTALVLSWLHRYLTGRGWLLLDVLDAVAVTAFALASPVPAAALGVTFSALWFRAVYGRAGEIWFYAAAQCAGLVAALLLWQVVPGHQVAAPAAPLLSALPIAPLLAVVARHLAVLLHERERAQGWDTALSRLGSQLLGLTDVATIRQRGLEAANELHRLTPGLRSVVVGGTGPRLEVLALAGPFPHPLRDLDRAPLADRLAAAAATGQPQELTASPELREAAGLDDGWLVLPLPDEPDSFVLLGAPGALRPEDVQGLRLLLDQVALAISASSAHRALEVQARTDALTGLANRSTFSAALDAAASDVTVTSWVLFIDLDDFKVVNDQLGHAAGDDLLRAVGARLSGTVRAPGLCARLGGDEFAVLVHADDADDVRVLGQRLIDAVSAPVQLADGTARVGASIGAARVVAGTPWTETLQQADAAMYAAKAAGRNQVQLTPDHQVALA